MDVLMVVPLQNFEGSSARQQLGVHQRWSNTCLA
jgi:hypothetical protein